MNKTIMKKYYEMQGKVILPEQKDNDNLSLAATVAANFISIGLQQNSCAHLQKQILRISRIFMKTILPCCQK